MKIPISRKELVNQFHLFNRNTLYQGSACHTDIDTVILEDTLIAATFKSVDANPTIHLYDRIITEMECTCMGPSYCSHLVGLLNYLLHNINEQDDPHLSSPKIKPPDVKPLMEIGPVDQLRKVLDISKLISYAFSDEPSSFYANKKVEIYSDRDHELNIEYNGERGYYYGDFIKTLIHLVWSDGDLHISCSLCSFESNAPCKHQELILNDEKTEIIHKFLEKTLEIEPYYSGNDDLRYFSTAQLKDNFYVQLTDLGRFHLRPKSNMDLLTASTLKMWVEDPQVNLKHEVRQDLILEQLYKDDNQGYGNAVKWSGNLSNIFIEYLSGKMTKDKNKLSSHIEIVKDPRHIPYEIQIELRKISNSFNPGHHHAQSLYQEQSLELIKQKADRLDPYIHYFHEPSYSKTNKVKKQDLHLFEFSKEILKIEVDTDESEDSLVVSLQLKKLQKAIKDHYPVHYLPFFAIIGNEAYLYATSAITDFIATYGAEQKFLFSPNDPETIRQGISYFVNQYKIHPTDLKQDWVQTIRPVQRRIHVAQVESRIHLTPQIVGPDPHRLIFDVLSEISHPANEGSYIICIPDQKPTTDFIQWCAKLHPRLDTLMAGLGFYALHLEDFIQDQWFLDFSEACEKAGVEITGWDSLKDFSFNPHRGIIEQVLDEDSDWFDIHFTIRFGDISVPQKDWIRAVRKGERSVLLKDGTYGIIPEEWRIRTLKLLSSADANKEKIRLSKLHFNALDQFIDLSNNPKIQKEIERKKARLINFKGMKKFDLPKTINAQMRPYQKDGYNWLRFLNEYQFGGCLADDMGLGKTLQVLCLLTDQKEKGHPTSLVVVPRTLMYNWVAEIEKFSPELTYLVHHGSARGLDCKEFGSYDLVISVYGTVTRDIDWLKEHPFHYIILDESQAIKNSASLRYKSIMQLKGKHKITMTGTPIENSTMDLFAQFNFVNPGLLGNKTQFRKNFSDPIEKEGSTEARELLQKIIHPFILRRTKTQVTKDLPAKTESILYCEMEAEQKSLYDKIKNEIRVKLLAEEKLEQNKIQVLEGLLKLRQICNSPALLPQNGELKVSSKASSIKIDTLMEQIEEVVGEEKHSILVFSQFTSMLSLIRQRLEKQNFPYSYLDGSTTNRKAVIEAFNSNEDVKIFLLSLKAGNVGLNLTKADFVYLIDPWWNPAVEAQAIDRTHRIGQTKPVFAYRLICKDTVEEKILKLQSKKNKLAEDLIQTDENVFKSLDKAELISLFE